MNKILLVDDEQSVLDALRRELRGLFEIETFSNPVEAIERCKQVKFDLVVADYKMPEMNGIEFLKQFGELQSDAARLVLSGEADIDALVRTINETHIYRFLSKPWEKAELLSSILQALAHRETILASNAESQNTAEATPQDSACQIVLVENDERLSALMARGLTDENTRDSICDAMRLEFKSTPTQCFKCTVSSFRSAQAALDHVEKNPCDLIIASQKLPDMDGIQLLHRMKQNIPDTARILISTEPDKTMLAQAINDAEVQSLLHLYWSSHELRTDVRRQAWNIFQLKTAAIQALAARALMLSNGSPKQ
ncbi:MAG: response regulator [Gallionellaceae bacterium]